MRPGHACALERTEQFSKTDFPPITAPRELNFRSLPYGQLLSMNTQIEAETFLPCIRPK